MIVLQLDQLLDDGNPPNTVLARTSVGIHEYPVGSGHYAVTLTAPGVLGQYSVLWDTDPGGNATPSNYGLTHNETYAVYAQDLMQFSPQWTVLAGLGFFGVLILERIA